MILNGIKAVVIYDFSAKESVQIENVLANTFDFSQDFHSTGEAGPSGEALTQSHVSAVAFSFIDSTGTLAKKLESWMNSRTRVSLVAVGAGRNLQWYESDHFVMTQPALTGITTGRGDVYTFTMRRVGHGRHLIYSSANLLAYINSIGESSWVNSAGTAKSYTSLGLGTLSWDIGDNSQSVDHNAEDAGIYIDILFPVQIAGIDMNLTTEIVDLHSETSTAKFELISLDSTGAEIANTASEPGTVGRHRLTHSLAADDMWWLRVVPIATPSGITLTNIVEGKEPALRTDTSNLFTDS